MPKIRVKVIPDDTAKEIDVEGPLTAGKLLELLRLSRESYVVMVNGRPVPEPEVLEGGEVVVIRVLSGG